MDESILQFFYGTDSHCAPALSQKNPRPPPGGELTMIPGGHLEWGLSHTLRCFLKSMPNYALYECGFAVFIFFFKLQTRFIVISSFRVEFF